MIEQINYEELLKQNNLIPLERWNHFSFTHKAKVKGEEENEQIVFLKRALQINGNWNSDGLYAYKRGSEIIYIGKGQPIFNRLKSHYREAFRAVSGDTKDKRWHRFFSSNTGKLTIYWIPVEDEATRKILELALHEHFKPTFEEFK